MSVLELLTIAYGATWLIALIGYIPTIATYLRKPAACLDASVSSWALWTLQCSIVVAYAVLVNGDIMFILSNVISFACCAAVLGSVLLGRARMVSLRKSTAIVVNFPNNPVPPKPVRMGVTNVRRLRHVKRQAVA